MRLIVSVFFVVCCYFSYGQDSVKSINKNAVTFELAGYSRSLISVNYERLFKVAPKYFYLSVRTGVGWVPGDSIRSQWHRGTVSVPGVLSLIVGKKKHYGQLSVGYTASFGEEFIDSTKRPPKLYQKFEPAYSVSLGYRYQWEAFMGQLFPIFQWTNNPTNKFSVGFGFCVAVTF